MDSRFASGAEWFAARRADLSRGGRWLEGDEPGRPDPRGFDRASLRILICRLSSYDDVAASITHRVLLSTAQAVPGVHADLAFFPPATDAALMRRDGVPPWLASGAKRPPADFDVVAVSLSVQQEAVNLPVALRDSGLRLDFTGRMADARHPLVILGGHAAGSAPFLHGDAAGPGTGGLVDAVCLGDGITWLREFLRRLLAARASRLPKLDFLAALARELPGTYAPAFYRHVYRQGRLAAIEPDRPGLPLPVAARQDPITEWLKDYDGAYIPFTEEETEETLPLAAGCAYRCRFCQTGWMRKDFSVAPPAPLRAAALRLKAAMVNSDLNLLASDACSVAGLERIVGNLQPLFRHVSVKSLSVSSLVRRPESFRLLRMLAKHEFTFGVEGLSARLRAYLGKPATAGDLLRVAEALAGGGLRQLKLFFIVTGLEEERDRTELEQLLKNLRARVPASRIIASFMPLFHAPFTPLQFAPVQPLRGDVEKSLSTLVRQAGGEFRWSAHPDEIALMNRLCRAGRAATPALVDFSLRRGLRYHRRLDAALLPEFERELPDHSGELDLDSVLPWNDLHAGADAATLWRSYQRAVQELRAEPAAAGARPAAAPRSPATAAEPAATAEPKRVGFWTWIRPEQARHPDHVLARARFRELFVRWRAGTAAYLGKPLLLRPGGTAGWAVASAEFKPGTRIPARGLEAERVDLDDFGNDRGLFTIGWPNPGPAPRILDRLKEAHVKFQTFRRGADRWHVLERSGRGRTGIVALQEGPDQTWLHAQRLPPDLAAALATLDGPPGVVATLWVPAAAPCPACGGERFDLRKSAHPAAPSICFKCLTRPDPT